MRHFISNPRYEILFRYINRVNIFDFADYFKLAIQFAKVVAISCFDACNCKGTGLIFLGDGVGFFSGVSSFSSFFSSSSLSSPKGAVDVINLVFLHSFERQKRAR